MAILEQLIKKILTRGVIIAKEKISERAYKIQIHSEAVQHFDFIPGCFIRLGVGIGQEVSSTKDRVRSYSIWDINKAKNTFSLAIATASGGIGAKWVEGCSVGDTVYYKTKKGTFTIDDSADSYLMIGDLSALSHLYVINRYLPKNKQVKSLIYAANVAELYADIDQQYPFDFYHIEAANTKQLLAQVDQIMPSLNGVSRVYIAGDSRDCIALNTYFRKGLQYNPKRIKTKPFWNPTKKGLE